MGKFAHWLVLLSLIVSSFAQLDTKRSVLTQKIYKPLGLESKHSSNVDPLVGFVFDEANPKVGQLSVRKCQLHKGICVFGTVKIEDKDGQFKSASVVQVDPSLSVDPSVTVVTAKELVATAIKNKYNNENNPSLKASLVIYPTTDSSGNQINYLAWHVEEQGTHSKWNCFVDAHSGDFINCFNKLLTALDRSTYTAQNTVNLPGNLAMTETQSLISDDCILAAHVNAKIVYDFFYEIFDRDSYDNDGATIVSSVHFDVDYNNAFWNGDQMVYGDGDGIEFSCLSQSVDVVAHEISHGVTSYESDLIYQGESGAINEAFSDIMGAGCEAFKEDITLQTQSNKVWLIGEDIYTPGISGDELRDLCEPSKSDGTTFYPELYTGDDDNGGVHTNSGIMNLAFCLMVKGGKHYEGKSWTEVPPMSFADALKTFYYANTEYMTPDTNFLDARQITLLIAQLNWGIESGQYNTIAKAWDAVGVTDPLPNTPSIPPRFRHPFPCTEDDDCPYVQLNDPLIKPDKILCDIATGICVGGCRPDPSNPFTSTQCTDPKPRCNTDYKVDGTSVGKCDVECRSHTDCRQIGGSPLISLDQFSKYCKNSKCVECTTNADCQLQLLPVCDQLSSKCVGCKVPTDCSLHPAGKVCKISGKCGCDVPTDCTSKIQGSICNANSKQCSCGNDLDCKVTGFKKCGQSDLFQQGVLTCGSCNIDTDCAQTNGTARCLDIIPSNRCVQEKCDKSIFGSKVIAGQCGCRDDNDCGHLPSTPACDCGANKCIVCQKDKHCKVFERCNDRKQCAPLKCQQDDDCFRDDLLRYGRVPSGEARCSDSGVCVATAAPVCVDSIIIENKINILN